MNLERTSFSRGMGDHPLFAACGLITPLQEQLLTHGICPNCRQKTLAADHTQLHHRFRPCRHCPHTWVTPAHSHLRAASPPQLHDETRPPRAAPHRPPPPPRCPPATLAPPPPPLAPP